MKVSEILAAKEQRIVAVGPETLVRDTADTLGKERIGAVLVRQADDKLVGIVSERDIVRNIAKHGQDALDGPVSDLMSRDVITCTPESSTEELIEQMLTNGIRHLPVMQEGALVGMVSVNDIMKVVLNELKWREKVLREQIVTAVGWSTDED